MERLTQKAIDRLAHSERAEFADHLETARIFWRKYREMVEAPEFPEPFRSAYIRENDYEPGDDSVAWALRDMGRAESDKTMLRKMGISLEERD